MNLSHSARQKLPVYKFKDQVLSMIEKNRVCECFDQIQRYLMNSQFIKKEWFSKENAENGSININNERDTVVWLFRWAWSMGRLVAVKRPKFPSLFWTIILRREMEPRPISSVLRLVKEELPLFIWIIFLFFCLLVTDLAEKTCCPLYCRTCCCRTNWIGLRRGKKPYCYLLLS